MAAAAAAFAGGRSARLHIAPAATAAAVHRSFRFDRVHDWVGESPDSLIELDQMAMTSMKTLRVPAEVKRKMYVLLKEFGHKKGVEAMGRFVARRQVSRTSSELPRVLPSRLLPTSEEGESTVQKLLRSKTFKDLQPFIDAQKEESLPPDSEILRLALAQMDDSQHKLYRPAYSPEAAVAHVLHRFTDVWASMFRILFEVAKRLPDYRPRTLMEFGAGAAPGTLAAHQVWEGGFSDALCVEPSQHLQAVGKFMASDMPAVRWQAGVFEVTSHFDLVIASHSLMAIKGQESRDFLIKNLWNRVKPGGILVVVEKGTPTGFRFIHSIREVFIGGLEKEHFHFVAPCPHEGLCPISVTGRDWCHFKQKLHHAERAIYNRHKGRNTTEETFSFLAIRKGPGPRLLFDSADEAPSPALKSFFWPRVVLPVMKRGKHVVIDVCSAPQLFQRITVSKSKPHSSGYKFARRTLWGDLWRFPKRVIRPEARAYTPKDTQQHLERLARRAYRALKGGRVEAGLTVKEEQNALNSQDAYYAS
uniref:Ribosomal small subunit Rsm22 n=1 Tax=Chromera velia CCMP2878 TaxID=1169474 RepID=A0A0G4GVQ8_9ALVE|eukprot:Cvel_5280.t1-p1 / transcript=Cvel_5280.t1 / gene=Cvel_5280 / organism=Chromera_velia_CCMP2878 / gene_product=Methyltransferase-like protein 17, mitochondrial, putative / transcript_product=Methyltransferase-like protein 17, mitochondrial, putative / location=Cvel_scaffold244:19302-25459(+) / protein_length=530 / sequence_SO=supercontig / SO=protein_coding / is_pseudo=false